MPGWKTEKPKAFEYEYTIKRAFYGKDSRYNNGLSTILHWEGETDSPNPDFREKEIFLSLGDGWDEQDDGKSVAHNSGDPEKDFGRRSYYGMVIERCIKDLGIAKLLEARGEPTEAKVWEGLKFKMRREEINFGSNVGVKEREMPIEFLGEVGEGTTATGTSTTSTAAGNGDVSTQVRVLEAKVKAALNDAPSFDDFTDKALSIEGVDQHSELVNKILDEQNGYWAARA